MHVLCMIINYITYTGATNQYVDVKFEQFGAGSTTRVVCTFLNELERQHEKSCMIVYGPCEQENNMMTSQVGNRNSSNTVIIDLPINLQSNNYCFVVSANGSFTVQVEGKSSEHYLYYAKIIVVRPSVHLSVRYGRSAETI